MRRLGVLACVVVMSAVSVGQLKSPPSQSDDAKKFHLPKVVGTPASVRLQGYEQRKRMEAESYYSKLPWRQVGPEIQGGRVVHFATPALHPTRYFCAFATGGLWVSEDLGFNWTPIFDNESAFAIGDFALSRDGKTIWIGTGENNSQRTSYSGMGVFKSTDGGATWSNMGLAETHRIGRVAIDPKNENTVWVGAIGALYSQDTNRGVYKTTDGGKTWSHVLKLDEYTGVIDLVIDPRNPQVVYAAAWDRDRRAWNFRDGGPGTAIYKTIDGGKSWNKLTNGLPNNGDLGRIGLAIAPTKPDRIYAFIDNQGGDEDSLYRDENTPNGRLTARRFRLIKDPKVFTAIERPILNAFFNAQLPRTVDVEATLKALNEGTMTLDDLAKKMEERNPNVWQMDVMHSEVYRSVDAGKTWKKANVGYLDTEGYGYYCGRISVSPHNPDDIVIMSMLLWRSTDGGRTFKRIGQGTHVDYHSYWIDPTNPKFHVMGNDGGLYFSNDDAATWRHINRMPVGQFTTIAVDTKTPYNIMGGLQDNGTLRGPSTYRPSRDNPWLWTAIGGGDGSALAVDPRDDGDHIYGASQFGAHFARNIKTNEFYQVRPRPDSPAERLRFNWVSPIQISPHHPDIVYIGSQKLHRSLNKGRAFESLSPDLTKNLPNGDVPFSTLTTLSESPFKFGQIYAGADDGSLKMTNDHGNTWTAIPTPAPNRWVTRVVASKHDRATVYVSQTGYRDDDYTPYLWKSTDNGKTWTSIASNLPPEFIYVIREDLDRKDWLYVGTNLGVFFTTDGGKNWIPLHGSIPRTPVHDLVIQPSMKELVIASHARSVFTFKLDLLYKVFEQREKPLHVWSISDMTRGTWEYRNRPDYDVADPSSPAVTGEMFTATGGAGSVRIKDKDGKVVLDQKMDWARGYNPFSVELLLKRGAPRYSTDVKGRKITTATEAVADPYYAERFQYLPAGEYTIEVTVGDKTETLKWKLG